MEVDDVLMGRKCFELKWGAFAGACCRCHKFGHFVDDYPTFKLHPPPNSLPLPALVNDKASPSKMGQAGPMIGIYTRGKGVVQPQPVPQQAQHVTVQKA